MKKFFFLFLALFLLAALPARSTTTDSYAYGSGFLPTSISNLSLWFDAADIYTITSSAGAVSQWNDKSGNGWNATQGTGANQPTTGTRTVNGRNVLDFDGTNDTLAIASGAYVVPNTTATCLAVHAGDLDVTQGRIYNAQDAGANRFIIYTAATNTITGAQGLNGAQVTRTFNTSAHILVYRREGTTNRIAQDGSGTQATSVGAVSFTATEFNIGSQHGTNLVNGVIGEMICYNQQLSDANLNLVGNYLGTKWGVTWTNF